MRITIRAVGLEPPASERLEDQLRLALGRFERRLPRVAVDVGPSGGPAAGAAEWRCQICGGLGVGSETGQWQAEGFGPDPFAAVARAAGRAGRLLDRWQAVGQVGWRRGPGE